ncbi:MAG TPA: hypothetical protein VMW69_13290, partial [Spirochaetia bacterium]|nr:hypothetical protein [Spirochaetia bacterium]
SQLFIKHGIRKESLLGYTLERFAPEALESFSVTQLEQAISLLLDLYRNIRFSLNQRFELDLVLSRLSSLSGYITAGEILTRIQSIRSEMSGGRLLSARSKEAGEGASASSRGPVRSSVERPRSSERSSAAEGAKGDGASSPEPPAATSDEDDDPDGYDEGWEPEQAGLESEDSKEALLRREVVAGLKKSKLNLSSALEKAVSWTLAGDILTISFTNSFQATLVREEISVVAEKVLEVLGRNVKIAVATADGSTIEGPDRHADENVELVKKIFRGEVIQGGE